MSGIADKFNGTGSGRIEGQASNSLKPSPQNTEEEKQWVAALHSRNCIHLMALLSDYPDLWLQTAPGNRSVLHVAVMQGCVELVKQVLCGPPNTEDNLEKFRENLEELLHAKDGNCRADAFDLSGIVGNQKVIQVLKSARLQLEILKESSKSIPCKIDAPGASHHTNMESTSFDTSLEVEIAGLLKELPGYKSLQKQMEEDVDYNFEGQRKGLVFNFACKKVHSNIGFLQDVVTKFREKGIPLEKLFTQMDAQGRTPMHVAVDHCKGVELDCIRELLELMPDECVNKPDAAGRTPLLRATVNGMSLEASKMVKVLVDDERTDLNAEWPGKSGASALHLAALHGHETSAKIVLEAHRAQSKPADVEKKMSRSIKVFKQTYSQWTPLQLAAVMGRNSVVVKILDASSENGIPIHDEKCLHLAAAAGDPQSIQALLLNQSNDLQHFESNDEFKGYSCLHFAVFAYQPHQRFPPGEPFVVKAIDEKFDPFLAFSDFASIYWLEQELTTAARKGPQKLGMPVPGYGAKKTCTTLLLQAGVDIWPSKNFLQAAPLMSRVKSIVDHRADSAHNGQNSRIPSTTHIPTLPDPGFYASDDDRRWWFDLVAKETLEAKNSFNAAGNATAVVATLVATASYIGPLTPPLGYGSDDSSPWTLDHVQMGSLPVRVFMESNSISFYLAIASIMLAIMPSLPMPQEGLREELHRSQRTVALAITMLLLSILGLLISFTSSLIAAMPRHRYWSFTFSPAFVGWIICSVVLFLFFLRLLRLIFNRNARIRSFYHFSGIL